MVRRPEGPGEQEKSAEAERGAESAFKSEDALGSEKDEEAFDFSLNASAEQLVADG